MIAGIGMGMFLYLFQIGFLSFSLVIFDHSRRLMTHAQSGAGGGGEEVDWDAVFRTIDHQQVGNVARGLQSGSGVGGIYDPAGVGVGAGAVNTGMFRSDEQWSMGIGESIHGLRHGPLEDEADNENENENANENGKGNGNGLYQQFKDHLAKSTLGETSSQSLNRERERRTRDSSREREERGWDSIPIGVSTPYDAISHDLPFRAMLHAMSNDRSVDSASTSTMAAGGTGIGPGTGNANGGQQQHGTGDVPAPQPQVRNREGNRGSTAAKGRGRRRSASLVSRRLASGGLPPIPLLTPQLNLYTKNNDHFSFTNTSTSTSTNTNTNTNITASASGSNFFPHPQTSHQPYSASALPSHTDFFSMLSQTPHSHQSHSQSQSQSQSRIPSSTTTPAPTPFPFLGGNGFTMNTNTGSLSLGGYGRSQLGTPLGSPGLRFGHGHVHRNEDSRDMSDPTPPSPSTGHSGNGNGNPNGDQAGTPGGEADGEDKRVRNTMASARFRAKRKAHLAEVEQQINHLENRSTTLRRQVEDLRKENIFLKEMVQLKYGLDVDKRL